MEKKPRETSAQKRIYLYFILCTALELLVALLTAGAIEFLFVNLNIIDFTAYGIKWYWILVFMSTSIIIGLALAALLGRVMFKPINMVMDGMTELADGNYSHRINLDKYDGMQNLANSFNMMAKELESTEILRSNFVNDFSHELKTPIVSIVGLISLMKNEKLSPSKRAHYLDIMETEANRLKQMTSNSLYLSKLETQNIITDKSTFNLSEQIRSSVLLLERKWTAKALSLSLDFDEYNIFASEDMLKEVWINLIDNAVKFAYEKSELVISVTKHERMLQIDITNSGEPIPEDAMPLLFNKFYQADKSRSTEGNGIGLSIVKHIVTMHGGSVSAACADGRTTFSVKLPY